MKLFLFISVLAAVVAPSAIPYGYLDGNAVLYTKTDSGYVSLFILPQTYFVAIEERGDLYDKVTYLDVSGYILSDAYSAVSYEPVTKYAEKGKAALKSGVASVFMYSDVTCRTALCTVSSADTIFLYGKSNVDGIYYCRVDNGETFRGYVRGDGLLITLPPDNIVEAVVIEPEVPPEPSDTDYESPLSLPVEIILIICLALPAFLLVFILTKKQNKKD